MTIIIIIKTTSMNLILYSYSFGKIVCSVEIKNIDQCNTLGELKSAWLKITFPHYMTTLTNINYCIENTHIFIWNTNNCYEGNNKTLNELGISESSHLSIVSSLKN